MSPELFRTFRPLTGEQLQGLTKTARAASGGDFEPFKISSLFDAAAKNHHWLGEEPERLRKLMPA